MGNILWLFANALRNRRYRENISVKYFFKNTYTTRIFPIDNYSYKNNVHFKNCKHVLSNVFKIIKYKEAI